MNVSKELEQVLLQVQKPARYTGGELNSVVKDPAGVRIRFAFCFPDTYGKDKIVSLPSAI